MDYTNFILFINEKKLQPKSDKQADVLKKQQELKNQETPITIRRFSIKNVIGFFKNTVSKIQDSVKKYDEERAEDFMDAFTNKGKLYSKIGEFLPFARFSA